MEYIYDSKQLKRALKNNKKLIYIVQDIDINFDFKIFQNNIKIIGIESNKKIPVLHFNKDIKGITITSNNCVLKNLIIENSNDCGLRIKHGSNNNKIINCIFRYNQNSGLSITKNSSNNKIINCFSYMNCDFKNFGKSADGFSCKLQAGPNNKFINCYSFENSDDGFDNYENHESVYYINCISFNNGKSNLFYNDSYYISEFKGNGNGFKLGSIHTNAYRYIKNCIAFDNQLKGFDQNNSCCNIDIKNTNSFNNGINYKLENCKLNSENNLEHYNQETIDFCNLIKENCKNNIITPKQDLLRLL